MKRIAGLLSCLVISLGAVFVAVPAQAADTDIPLDCSTTEAYYLAVIDNYRAEVTRLEGDVTYWRAAHDRVAAAAASLNVEYAAAVEKNRTLTDTVNRKNSKIQELRQVIRDLRGN